MDVLFPYKTPYLVLFDIFLVALFYYMLFPVVHRREEITPYRFKVFMLLLVIYLVFAFWNGDWYNYQGIFVRMNKNPLAISHMEEFYDFLMRSCPNYYSFRLVVWGSALTFVHLIIERVKLNKELCYFFFAFCFLHYFSYARVSLAVVVLLYGVIVFQNPYKYVIPSRILGIALIIGSSFLHKSAPLGLLPVVFSLFVKPANRNSWFYLMLAFVSSVVILRVLFTQILSLDFGELDEYANDIQNSQNESIYFGQDIGYLVTTLCEHIPYFLVAALSFRIQNEYDMPKGIEAIVKFHFYIVLFSILFAMDLGGNTSQLYYRLLRFSIVPASITISYAYQYGLFPRMTKITALVCMMGGAITLVYTLYDAILNPHA